MARTVQIAVTALAACLFVGCRHKEGFYIKSYDSKSDKLILLRYKTNSTITASCLATRDMKDDKPRDGFGQAVEQLCLNLPTHVGETIKEGKLKNEIDKTIAVYFHLDDTGNQVEIWNIDDEETH